MTVPIRIEIAGTPVAKGRPRIGQINGRAMAFTPAHTRKYESALRLAATQAMGDRPPLDEPVTLTVEAVLPVPASWSKKRQREALRGERLPGSRPDLDNYAKAASDALNQIAYRDDSLVCELVARKRYGERPRIEITVEPVRLTTV